MRRKFERLEDRLLLAGDLTIDFDVDVEGGLQGNGHEVIAQVYDANETLLAEGSLDLSLELVEVDGVVTGTVRAEDCEPNIVTHPPSLTWGNFVMDATLDVVTPVAQQSDQPTEIIVEAGTTVVTVTTFNEVFTDVTPDGDVAIHVLPGVDVVVDPGVAEQIAELEAEVAALTEANGILQEENEALVLVNENLVETNDLLLDQVLEQGEIIVGLEAEVAELQTQVDVILAQLQGIIEDNEVEGELLDVGVVDEVFTTEDPAELPYVGYPLIPRVIAGPCPEFCPPVEEWGDLWDDEELGWIYGDVLP